jgi:hypothetical protein
MAGRVARPTRFFWVSVLLSITTAIPAFAQDEPAKPPDPQPGDDAPLMPPEEPKKAEPEPKKEPEPKAAVAPDDVQPSKAEGQAAGEKPAEEKKDRPIRDSIKLVVGPLSLLPVILIQAQALPYVGDDSFTEAGDAADSEGFRLRRGRLGLELGLAADGVTQGRGRVSFELGSREDGSARIHDAWLAYVGFPYAQAWGGALTVPFSRSAIAGSGDQALTERPLAVRSMTPGQQVGLVGRGEVEERAFVYDLGVFNGFSRSDQFYSGYAQNFAPFGNKFEGLAYVARLATEPVGVLSPTIADETHQSPRFGAGASYFYSDGGARGIHAFGGDALLHAAGFHLLGEVIYSVVSPKSDPEEPTATVVEVKSLGVVAEAGYMILRDLLGVTARFEYIDPSSAVDDEGDNWLLGGGATVMFFEGMVRITAEYTHREEMFGLSLENDAVVLQAQLVAP